MTPEAQRIAIAEACGWKQGEGLDAGRWLPPSMAFYQTRNELPDYINDLNAMHEAEKVLTKYQRPQFLDFLAGETSYQAEWSEEGYLAHTELLFQWLHATAAQRAEAFLRAIEKWIE